MNYNIIKTLYLRLGIQFDHGSRKLSAFARAAWTDKEVGSRTLKY